MKRFLAVVLLAATAAAQSALVQQPVVGQPVYVTAIELVADVRETNGNVPSDLGPSDFSILEDGVERPVIGVDYLSSDTRGVQAAAGFQRALRDHRHEQTGWQIVLFFDLYLSSAATIRNATDSFIARAGELAQMGAVSIIASRPGLEFRLMDSRSADAIRAELRKIRATAPLNWIARHHRQYQFRSDMARVRPMMTDLAVMGQAREMDEFLRGEILAEVDAIERSQAAIIQAVGRFPRRTPSALFIVTEGFDTNAASYYEKFSTDLEDIRRIRANPLEYNVGDTVDAIARVLAASGWTTIGVHSPPAGGEQWIDDASRSMIGRVSTPRATEALYVSERGNDPLVAFAAATGGSAGPPGMLAAAVRRLDEAVIISYQVSRAPDGKPRRIEVKPKRPGLTVRTVRWATESTPGEIAATRTLSLVSDKRIEGGDLPTDVSLEWTGRIGPRRDGMIVVTSSLAMLLPLMNDRQTAFRVTVAVTRKNFPPMVVHRMVHPSSASDPFVIRVPIEAGDEPIDVAASVEELTTGLWGGGRTASNGHAK